MERLLKVLSLICAFLLVFFIGYSASWFDRGSLRPLDYALQGVMAWVEKRNLESTPLTHGKLRLDEAPAVNIWDEKRADNGYTFITGAFGSRAFLLDMKGAVVHQWELPFSQAWKGQTHVKSPVADERISWFKARLFPNGDILANYSTGDDTPYGYGLAKLDKDSHILWKYSDHSHHDFDLDDKGIIFTLAQNIDDKPIARLPYLKLPTIADYVVKLSPDGKELERVSIVQAFADSEFDSFLDTISVADTKGDYTHTNSLQLLTKQMAPFFPQFKAGQILLSLRSFDAIAVLDFDKKKIVWAAKGPWRHQHSASFLDNGRILLLDNSGRYTNKPNSRVLEFNPATLEIPWVYSGTTEYPFNTNHAGQAHRLSNGNTLIVSSMDGHLFEVTTDLKLVWHYEARKQFNTLLPSDDEFILQTALRYKASELPFLKTNH